MPPLPTRTTASSQGSSTGDNHSPSSSSRNRRTSHPSTTSALSRPQGIGNRYPRTTRRHHSTSHLGLPPRRQYSHFQWLIDLTYSNNEHNTNTTISSTAMDDFSPTIRVAILGGGLAGVAVLRGLLKLPHLVVDIYESRPVFRDEAPAVQLSPATHEALRLLDPALENCLDRAGGVYSSTELRVAAGPDAGLPIPVRGFSDRDKRTVGRQALLNQLLEGIPPRCIHVNTRITSIENGPPQTGRETGSSPNRGHGGGSFLNFADGTRKHYDVVIGADGVHGIVRSHVLGPNDPAVEPEPSGFWGLHAEVPMAKAQEEMGGTAFLDPTNPSRTGWIGDGTFMLHNILSGGQEVQIVIGAKMDERERQGTAYGTDAFWAKLFTPNEFERIFAGNQGEACKGMIRLIQSIYTIEIAGIVQMQHRPARTLASSAACLIGDSAHAMLGFQGGGVTIAIEEALVLSTLMSRVGSRSDIPFALRAYDLICRPRAEHAARASQETGLLCSGGMPGVGLDGRLLAEQLGAKWDFLHDVDIEAHRSRAVQAMEQLMMATIHAAGM